MQSIEFCAGAGGQAIGLEQAGFQHSALVEIEPDFAKTLRLNRPEWDVRTADMNAFDGRPFAGVDLVAKPSMLYGRLTLKDIRVPTNSVVAGQIVCPQNN